MEFQIISDNIQTVGDLIDGLSKLPRDTKLTPYGDSECVLATDNKGNAYLDTRLFVEDLVEESKT